ncbi:MAG: 6-pyruvoyl-tetrahydropterin synthase-related protein, partial [Acidimicrobiales bacterium]
MRRPAAPLIVTFGAVAGVIVVVLWQVHPSLLLSNTTITGGDTGAHVGLAAFLKSNLLPHGHVTGWDPGAYDGFALNTFYFPLPDLLAALAGFVIPFNVAFKLMTILGALTLPVAAWLFGRLAGLERPRPAVLAIATMPFLFDQTFTIYGGNLYSTMAGEYAFSLGLSFALVFLGLAVRGMKTGRYRAWAAVILAVCILCHVLTAIFALVGAVIILVLAGPTWRRVWWMVASVGGGLLLVSWWAVPFLLDQAYSTNMGWLNVNTYGAVLWPGADRWAIVLAAVGTVLAVVAAVRHRQSAPLLLVVLGGLAALTVRYDRQWTLYNVRFLPFYILCVYLLAGYVVAEVGIGIAWGIRQLRMAVWRDAVATAEAPAPPSGDVPAPVVVPVPVMAQVTGRAPAVEMAGTPLATATTAVAGGPTLQSLPPRVPPRVPPPPRFAPWAPGAVVVPVVAMVAALLLVITPLIPSLDSGLGGVLHHQFAPSSVASWADWNYSGYQNTPGAKELYDGVIPT